MTNKLNKGGFTLIELLVVVLIIGILSSVALPQYTKAVEKSRASEAQAWLSDFVQGEAIYKMANGDYTATLGDLDIALPTSLKNFTVPASATKGNGTVQIALPRSGTSSTPYTLTVIMTHNVADGTDTIQRYCTGTGVSTCKAISNGATCANDGGTGDTPWCYKAS